MFRLADRDDAVRRHDRTSEQLDDLGPIARRLHRQERLRLEHARDRAADDVTRADADIADLADQTNDLAESLPTWKRWRADHQPGFDRLGDLSTINDRRLQLTIERARTTEVEVDLGVSL
jgi:hypothetical protein